MSLGGRPTAIQRRELRRRGPLPRSPRQAYEAKIREQVRAKTGATLEAGCPTTLPDGHYWFCAPTVENPVLGMTVPEPQWTAQEREVRRCIWALGTLHDVDPSTRDDAAPGIDGVLRAVNHGALTAVAGGRAIGYLIVSDDNGDGRYETLGNIWTATGARRSGVARGLLERLRADHPTIKTLERPITPMGKALIRAAAPDLL
jgi:hypothetical protein